MAEQLNFALPKAEALGRDDFFVSQSNSAALELIESPEDWQSGKCILIGAEASGKTHLTHVWAMQQHAKITTISALLTTDIDQLAQQPVAVEDIDRHTAGEEGETALFHLHNLLQQRHHPLLLTSRIAPGYLEITLPDLKSRVMAASVATLSPPDDALLAAMLLKQFSDRQMTVPATLIPYLLPRIERSFAQVKALVEMLDTQALSEKRGITRSLAKDVLQKLR